MHLELIVNEIYIRKTVWTERVFHADVSNSIEQGLIWLKNNLCKEVSQEESAMVM